MKPQPRGTEEEGEGGDSRASDSKEPQWGAGQRPQAKLSPLFLRIQEGTGRDGQAQAAKAASTEEQLP